MKLLLRFGHPAGLAVLFMSAMWEMYALFGVRVVLVYYLVQDLAFSQAHAVQVYGFSGAAIFATAIFGGFVADRVLGLKRSAFIGALVMSAGLFLLVFEATLYPALTVIAVGNGLYKPAMWTQVGLLYSDNDPRRERGYIIFHVGNNIGAIISALVAGWLGTVFGWTVVFFISSIGMLVSAAIILIGAKWVRNVRDQSRREAGELEGPISRRNLVLLAVAWIAAALFWTAYNQIGGTFALWVDQSVARSIQLGQIDFEVPAAWFQSINPILVFALAPFVTWVWSRERAAAGPARDLKKMIAGAMIMAASFAILSAAAALPSESGMSNALLVVLAIAPYTLAELVLPPVTASLFTRLSPARYTTVFFSLFFLTQAAGALLAGLMGPFWETSTPAMFFMATALIAAAAATVVAIARFFYRTQSSANETAPLNEGKVSDV